MATPIERLARWYVKSRMEPKDDDIVKCSNCPELVRVGDAVRDRGMFHNTDCANEFWEDTF